MRLSVLLAGAVLLTACGARGPLTPPESVSPPVAPLGATTAPSADELLRRDALAAPERSVELRRRSEERQDDPFDLPPE